MLLLEDRYRVLQILHSGGLQTHATIEAPESREERVQIVGD